MCFSLKKAIAATMAAGVMLTGCSKTEEQSTARKTENQSVALLVSTLDNPFFVTMKEGAEKKAKEVGLKLVVLDSKNDASLEMTNTKSLGVSSVRAILLNPADSGMSGDTVRAANRAGIPIITLDRGANGGEVFSHVASDNVVGGEMAGKFIAEQLGGKGNVIQLEGIPGTSVARQREEGFMKAVKTSGLNLVATQPADFDRIKALNVTENLLHSHPDVQAIFAQNDEMALGALKAAMAADKDILIVGFDGTDEAVTSVKEGGLTATVSQQAFMMGEVGIMTAVKLINGEDVDVYTPVQLQLITRD